MLSFFLQKYGKFKSNNVYDIVTCDESYVHIFSPVKGPAAKQRLLKDQMPKVQVCPTNRQKKFLALIFFSWTKIIHAILDTKKSSVNSAYYVSEGLKPMVKRWKEAHEGSDLEWLTFHQVNAPAHRSKHTTHHIDSIGIQKLPAPPYSPDLAPCDFWLFPRIKNKLRGIKFESIDAVKNAWKKELSSLQPSNFKVCSQE